MVTADGREFRAVRASEDVRFDDGDGETMPADMAGHHAEPGEAAKPGGDARRVLYYRNPMGLADTSSVPKKDSMGMDYIPVYAGEDEAGVVKVSPGKVQRTGVRTELAERRVLSVPVRAPGSTVLRRTFDRMGDIADAHTRMQGGGIDAEHVAEPAVVDEQTSLGVVEAEPLEHVAEGRVELGIAALELLLLLLEQGHVAADGDEAAPPRRAAADAQPTPVGAARLGGEAAGSGHRQKSIRDRRSAGVGQVAMLRFGRIESEHCGGPVVGEDDAAGRVDDDDPFDRSLHRIGEQALRAPSPRRHFLLENHAENDYYSRSFGVRVGPYGR